MFGCVSLNARNGFKRFRCCCFSSQHLCKHVWNYTDYWIHWEAGHNALSSFNPSVASAEIAIYYSNSLIKSVWIDIMFLFYSLGNNCSTLTNLGNRLCSRESVPNSTNLCLPTASILEGEIPGVSSSWIQFPGWWPSITWLLCLSENFLYPTLWLTWSWEGTKPFSRG